MAVPGAAGPGAKFPQWTYNNTTGAIDKVGNATAKALAEADAWPAQLIFFTSDQAARNYAKGTNVGGIDMSTAPVSGQVQSGVNQGTQALQDTLGNMFSLSASPSLVLRLAEGVLGVVLIAVGLARLTHAGGIVKTVAEVAK